MRHLYNPDLSTIHPDEQWKGTPYLNNAFVNHEFPFTTNFGMVLKWQLGDKPRKEEKKSDTWRLTVRHNEDFLNQQEDMITWLGHSTFHIRLNGFTFITDPVFGNVSLVKRLAKLPLNPIKLKQLDFLLLSHDHRDHCDERSLKLLADHHPRMQILTGLKMRGLTSKWMKGQKIQEAGWYQQYKTPQGIEVFYLPSRHWSRRGLIDLNQRLWGAFVIRGGGKTIYFMSDSGYGAHFKEAGELFPNPDICIMGIGAYQPEWFMQAAHISPTDAVKAFNEMKGKTFIPMHYGTFDLSDEPIGDPLRMINELKVKGEIKGSLRTPDVGESVRF
ncbi:MBL fold metallo-hydrolase [soil metagenome]